MLTGGFALRGIDFRLQSAETWCFCRARLYVQFGAQQIMQAQAQTMTDAQLDDHISALICRKPKDQQSQNATFTHDAPTAGAPAKRALNRTNAGSIDRWMDAETSGATRRRWAGTLV